MSYRLADGVVVMALAVGLVGCVGSDGSQATSVESPVATQTQTDLPEPIPAPWTGDAPGELSGEVVTALLAIRDRAPAVYPDHFVGIASGNRQSKDRLVIYLFDADSEIESQLLALSGLPEEKVDFEPAYQSLEAAIGVDRELASDLPELRRHGIEVNTWGVGVDGVEDIGIDSPTDAQVAHLFDRYGPYLRIDRNVGPATLL